MLKRVHIFLFLVYFFVSAAEAQLPDAEVSRAIGFVRQICPEGSDTWIGTPFDHTKRDAVARLRGRPRVIENQGLVVLYLIGAQPWQKDQWVDSHYVRIGGENRYAGRAYRIRSSSRTTVVIEYEDHFPREDYARGDEIELVPYPTLADLFPPETQTTFQESEGYLPLQRKTELLVFETERPEATDATPPLTFFLTTEGWKQVTDRGVVSAGHFRLTPWTAMIVRNRAGLGDTDFVTTGLLAKFPRWLPVRGDWSTMREIPTPAPILVPQRLAELNLNSNNNFPNSESTDPEVRGGELLIFAGSGFNQDPTAIYFRVNNEWRLDDAGNGYPVADDVMLEPGTALLVTVDAEAKEDEVRLTGQIIEPLDQALAGKLKEVKIDMDAVAPAIKLQERLKEDGKGLVKISFMAHLPGGRVAEMTLPGKWNVSPETVREISRTPGVLDIREF